MMLTNWGYTLTEIDTLPDMLDEDEYNIFSANRFAGDMRILENIKAACSAVRQYCGWHVFPSAACKFDAVIADRRISRVGMDLLIQLPAAFVSEVLSVTIGNAEYTTFYCSTNGILHVYNVGPQLRYASVSVTYTAGLPKSMMDGIKELIAHRVTHAESSSNGITSEAAGGVSVTYNANWINSARATALPSDNKEVLQPYRIQGVF